MHSTRDRGGHASTPVIDLREAAYRLAMLVLQSERYQQDPDARQAVDDVLALTLTKPDPRAPRPIYVPAAIPQPKG
jgi:hypothetical protein